VGTPREVYVRPDSEFIAGFIGETNLLPGHVSSQSDGHIRVKTDVGDVVALAVGAKFSNGDKVVLSVRPEVIRFDDAPADAPNQFDGAVHHSVYLGEVAQHQVTLRAQGDQAGGDSVTIKAFDLNPRIVARDGEARATIWVDPQDVIILTR
jgi:ABC-type Fe3+/spermidine/putrescine transport system ATPase subunit